MNIDFKDIVKLQRLYVEIFEEEDCDYPNRRIIAPKEKAIERILNKITNDNTKKQEIYRCVCEGTWCWEDNTYKPICDRLRDLGYVIKESDVK